ncbi:MAG: hypothetical protein OEW72_00040 [Gammaproteobacteria bacterium]|nr:hypothetical protein [Gammaproteobacteria bacterium]
MLPNPYTVALYAHVLVVVYLLGADLGRLLLARAGAAAGASPDTQLAAARTFSTLGSVTGTALILILPVGISLAGSLGVYRIISPAWLISTWVVTGAWLLLSVAADRAAGNPAGGGGLLLADGIARFVIGAGHLYDGAIAFAGTSQTVEARWLAAKITLFGVLILLSIPVRRTGFAIRREAALLTLQPGDAAAGGRLRAALGRLPVPVLTSWLLILAAAWAGVARPG